MSLPNVDAPTTAPGVGAAAAAARVAELQQMIAQAQRAGNGNGGASFSDALASASQPMATAAAYPAAQSFAATGAPATTVGASAGGQYDGLVTAAAQRYGIDPAVLHGLIQQESGFNPSAGSPAGAQGLAQLMPGTAASLGVTNPFDPAQSIDGGARYLRRQLDAFGGDVTKALAAYNAGPGAVTRYGGVPPYAETQAYVQKVLANADAYRQTTGATAATAMTASAMPITGTTAALAMDPTAALSTTPTAVPSFA